MAGGNGRLGSAPPSDRFGVNRARARDMVIEGEGRLIATSDPAAGKGAYDPGARVFHQKFGYGRVTAVEGNKLTVSFDKAGEKRVLDSFVEKA